MPNFLLIGAQKAGTTALSHYMKQHSQIYISPIKEPGFFDFEGQKPNFLGPGDRELFSHVSTDIESYRRLFQGVSNEIAIGEATTWYLYSSRAPERIQYYIPNVKLIVILRNPVDRAYSAYLHVIRDGRELITDFAQALLEEETRINQNWEYLWHYKQMGFYYAQLKRYFDLFNKNQIRVYLYEDLKDNPVALMQDICRFLNVDETLITGSPPRRNVSGIPKNKFLDYLLKKQNFKWLKTPFKLFLSSKMRENIIVNLNNKNLIKPQISPAARIQLAKMYREDILKLQELIERDLSSWLE
ncbi:MAG: sulfotransferase [Xenococcus sp. MO_188.B8]|nr:sulfotransferase [Xenococcus sp. MO_188.B8]